MGGGHLKSPLGKLDVSLMCTATELSSSWLKERMSMKFIASQIRNFFRHKLVS